MIGGRAGEMARANVGLAFAFAATAILLVVPTRADAANCQSLLNAALQSEQNSHTGLRSNDDMQRQQAAQWRTAYNQCIANQSYGGGGGGGGGYSSTNRGLDAAQGALDILGNILQQQAEQAAAEQAAAEQAAAEAEAAAEAAAEAQRLADLQAAEQARQADARYRRDQINPFTAPSPAAAGSAQQQRKSKCPDLLYNLDPAYEIFCGTQSSGKTASSTVGIGVGSKGGTPYGGGAPYAGGTPYDHGPGGSAEEAVDDSPMTLMDKLRAFRELAKKIPKNMASRLVEAKARALGVLNQIVKGPLKEMDDLGKEAVDEANRRYD